MRSITTLAIILSSTLFLAACGSSVKLDDADKAPIVENSGTPTDGRTVGTVDVGSTDPLNDPKGILAKRSIYFDYDSYIVKDDFKAVVEAHAKYLVANKSKKILIQGNTDERGGREYNLALGQKRAEAVRKMLALLGVSDTQMEAVSFGKEKPKALGNDEASWAEIVVPTSSTNKSAMKKTIVAVCMAAPLFAHAGLFSDDEARKAVLELREKVSTLQRETTEQLDNKADKSSVLDLSKRNDELKEETSQLRGQIEVLTNELVNIQRTQKEFYVDLDKRLRVLEPQKINVDGKEVSVDQSEQKTYDAALNLFKAGSYKNAAAAFTGFVHRYPQSGLAPSAQYFLGSSYYAQRDYRNAIAAQQLVLKNYPGSPKAADALLNLASCYTELKDKASAKKALQTLIEQYGESPAAQAAQERLATLK